MFHSLLNHLTHYFYNRQFDGSEASQSTDATNTSNKRQKEKRRGFFGGKGSRPKSNTNENKDPYTLSWENYTPIDPNAYETLFKETFPFSVNDYSRNAKVLRIPKIDEGVFYKQFLPQMLFNEKFFSYALEERMLIQHLKVVLMYNSGYQREFRSSLLNSSKNTGKDMTTVTKVDENLSVGVLNTERKHTISSPDDDATSIPSLLPLESSHMNYLNELRVHFPSDEDTRISQMQTSQTDPMLSTPSSNAYPSNSNNARIPSQNLSTQNKTNPTSTNDRKEHDDEVSDFHELDENQIIIALKILLNGFLKRPIFLCNAVIEEFSLDIFFSYLQTKELYPMVQELLLKYDDAKNPKSVFEYSIDIVWLAYAILGKLFSHMIKEVTLQNAIRVKKEPVRQEHLKVLKCYNTMFRNVFFLYGEGRSSDSASTSDLKINILENQAGIFLLEKFVDKTNLIFKTNEVHLVELALATIGQLISNANDNTLDFLLASRNRVDIRYIVSKYILCSVDSIVASLGRLIMTLICRNVHFIDELLRLDIGEDSSFVNELLYLSMNQDRKNLTPEKHLIQVQYLNILYIFILYSKVFTLFLINQKPFEEKLNAFLSMKDNFDLSFLGLQLLYGILHHEDSHNVIVPLSSMSRPTTNPIILSLKRLSFSPQSLHRFYALLIWRQLCRSQHQSVTYYLIQQEQMLNVLCLLLRDEKEISLTRLNLSALYEIIIRKMNVMERSLLINHYNILFELTQIFKEGVRYVRKYIELNSLQTVYPSMFLQYIGLLRDIYFIFVAFANYDQDQQLSSASDSRFSSFQDEQHANDSSRYNASASRMKNTSMQPPHRGATNRNTNTLPSNVQNASSEQNQYSIVNQLLDRYHMAEFFKGYLFVLSRMIENGNTSYTELHRTIKSSMEHLFHIGKAS